MKTQTATKTTHTTALQHAPNPPAVPSPPKGSMVVVATETEEVEEGGGPAGRGAEAFGEIVGAAGVGAASAAGGDLVMGGLALAGLGGQVVSIAAKRPKGLGGNFLMGLAKQVLPTLAGIKTFKAVDKLKRGGEA